MADDFARLLDSALAAGTPLDDVRVIDVDAATARAREVLSIVRGWPRPLAHDLLNSLREADPVLDELLILEGDPTAPDVRGILPAGRPIL
jgi:hypothetical protein